MGKNYGTLPNLKKWERLEAKYGETACTGFRHQIKRNIALAKRREPLVPEPEPEPPVSQPKRNWFVRLFLKLLGKE